MLPPSNSILHHSHKLAEVVSNMQTQVTSAPPPPYCMTIPRISPHEVTQSDLDIDEDESPWENSNPNPITIHINASINILGNNNSIIIPSMTAHHLQNSNAATETAPSSPSEAMLQSAQRQRQAKLTEMATSIIASLHSSGLLASAPVEININTGIKVEGSRNVVCPGAPGRVLNNNTKRSQMETDKDKDKDQYNTSMNRKRRAQSEPLSIPKSKRDCLL